MEHAKGDGMTKYLNMVVVKLLPMCMIGMTLAVVMPSHGEQATPQGESTGSLGPVITLMTEAQSAYDRGNTLQAVDVEAARAAFIESADGWRRAVNSGIKNGYLWANLGNAEFRAGRLGPAVAAYLEADRLMPGDATVGSNLALARNQVPARFDSEGIVVLYDTVSDGWHVLGFDVRWWIAGIGWVGFWSILAVRFSSRGIRSGESEGSNLAWRGGLAILGAVAIIFGTTIALDAAEDAWRTPGVLVEDSVIRTGNGETFAEVFSEPVPAGVEFDLIESRPGWHHINFADGREGWVRSDHAKMIGS
jgi:hypothetical protein